MGLFGGKKKEQIPDLPGASAPYRTAGASSQQPQQDRYAPSGHGGSSIHSAAPSYRTAPSYVPPSQGGGGYGTQSHYAQQPQHQYGYQEPVPERPAAAEKKGSWFGKKDKEKERQEEERQRNELLQGAPKAGQYRGNSYGGGGGAGGGYNPQPGHGQDGYGQHQGHGGGGGVEHQQQGYENDEDEEVEGIKQQMRFVKQDTLASSRNAVRIAREAEETARATLDKLGDQSDRIANTERHLDLAKAHNERAQDETKELEALNKSIFRPTFTFNKNAKRDREERRLLDRHNAEKAEREDTRREQYESRQRIDQTYHRMDREAENAAGAKARAKARGTERGRYQFEATASDDELEDELDGNLDELSGLAGRLKMLSTTMGQEVDGQNKKLGKLSGKVDVLDNNVVKSTQRLARVK